MKSRTKLKNAKPKPLRVVLADASLMSCKLLADALETQSQFRVVGCAVDGNELLNTLAEVKPDVALIGVHLQNGYQSGISSLQAAHGRHPSTPLILLIDRTEPQTVVEAFRAGAKGVFSRSQPEVGVLAKCIQRVIEGQIWVDNTQLLYLLNEFAGNPSESRPSRQASSLSMLTPREESVVRLVVAGMGNREISETLHLSPHTVKNYLVKIFEKLGLSSRVELVLFAAPKLSTADASLEQAISSSMMTDEATA